MQRLQLLQESGDRPLEPALELLAERGVALTSASGDRPDAEHVDTALMALFRDSSEPQAFELLYQRARAPLYGLLRRVVCERGLGLDPLELVQDTFVNVYRYRASFRDDHPASFRAWSRTIAYHSVSRAAGKRRTTSLQSLPEGMQEPVDPRSTPVRSIEGREDLGALRQSWMLFLAHYARAFARLSERDRAALEMIEVEGLTYAAAAARLSVGRSNIKMIVFRARARLVAQMSRAMGMQPIPLSRAG